MALPIPPALAIADGSSRRAGVARGDEKVMRFWMDMGADGFRADMAGALVKGGDPRHETLGYWREVRQILNTDYPQAFTVAEWSGPREALNGAFHADFYHWVDGFNDLYQKESWRIGNGTTDGHSFFDRDGQGDINHFLDGYLADGRPRGRKATSACRWATTTSPG